MMSSACDRQRITIDPRSCEFVTFRCVFFQEQCELVESKSQIRETK